MKSRSQTIFETNSRFIPGGVVSTVRKVEPEIAFVKGEGARIWDADGKTYLDYHGAFAAQLLGHNDPYVTSAVRKVLDSKASLYGSGTNELEGRLAELLCSCVPALEQVQLLNSGSEATMAAIRLARAITGRDHLIVMQGGFNGSHNDVSCNVLTPLEKIGPRVSPGEYRYIPLGPGVPIAHQQLVHIVNFNDLDSIHYVCERYPIAALITEPILQNIGVVKPRNGYLQGLRTLADQYGYILIFDEVKTGFRYSLGGYSQISQVRPDLMVLAKALANGYPISVLGGKKELMDYFAHSDQERRPLVAGTYNGHPVSVAAAIATMERLKEGEGEVYRRLERLGQQIESGIREILKRLGREGTVVRQGSAFCLYFMDHEPRDWHDVAANHDFSLDLRFRRALVQGGVYFFPVAAKQCSICAAHTETDIAFTLDAVQERLRNL